MSPTIARVLVAGLSLTGGVAVTVYLLGRHAPPPQRPSILVHGTPVLVQDGVCYALHQAPGNFEVTRVSIPGGQPERIFTLPPFSRAGFVEWLMSGHDLLYTSSGLIPTPPIPVTGAFAPGRGGGGLAPQMTYLWSAEAAKATQVLRFQPPSPARPSIQNSLRGYSLTRGKPLEPQTLTDRVMWAAKREGITIWCDEGKSRERTALKGGILHRFLPTDRRVWAAKGNSTPQSIYQGPVTSMLTSGVNESTDPQPICWLEPRPYPDRSSDLRALLLPELNSISIARYTETFPPVRLGNRLYWIAPMALPTSGYFGEDVAYELRSIRTDGTTPIHKRIRIPASVVPRSLCTIEGRLYVVRKDPVERMGKRNPDQFMELDPESGEAKRAWELGADVDKVWLNERTIAWTERWNAGKPDLPMGTTQIFLKARQ